MLTPKRAIITTAAIAMIRCLELSDPELGLDPGVEFGVLLELLVAIKTNGLVKNFSRPDRFFDPTLLLTVGNLTVLYAIHIKLW